MHLAFANPRGEDKKGEDNKDEKDKGNSKSKRKANAKATEYFAGYCLLCKAWGHMWKDCWNESAKIGKDTACRETPMTPANTTTEPPISGMFVQSEKGQVVPTDPAQWLHSVTKREPGREDFLIDDAVPCVFVKRIKASIMRHGCISHLPTLVVITNHGTNMTSGLHVKERSSPYELNKEKAGLTENKATIRTLLRSST